MFGTDDNNQASSASGQANSAQSALDHVGRAPRQSILSTVQQYIAPREPVLCPKNCHVSFLSAAQRAYSSFTVGNTIEFNLHLMDDFGREFGNVENQTVNPSSIFVIAIGCVDIVANVSTIGRDDGDATGTTGASSASPTSSSLRKISFCPNVSGIYAIHVKVLNEHVHGSPFKIKVSPGEVSISNCIVSSPLLDNERNTIGHVGQSMTVSVALRDQFGNAVGATHAHSNRLSVLFDKKMAPINDFGIKYATQDDKVLVSMLPNVEGCYIMQIFFDTEPLLNRWLNSDGWMEIIVLSKFNAQRLARYIRERKMKSYKVKMRNSNDAKDVLKDVTMVVSDSEVKFETYRLYFFAKVLHQFSIVESKIHMDYGVKREFTISHASFKGKIRPSILKKTENVSLPQCVVQTEELPLILALLKMRRTVNPLSEIELKLLLSSVFADFSQYSESELRDIYNLLRYNDVSNQLFQQYLRVYFETQCNQLFQNSNMGVTTNADDSSLTIVQRTVEEQTVDDIIHYESGMRNLIDKFFLGQYELHAMLRSILSSVVSLDNDDNRNVQPILSSVLTFGDQLMKSSSIDEKKIDKLIQVLRFAQDKDVVQTLYHRQLAQRLIYSNDETHLYDERVALAKLKSAFGLNFTFRMEGMMRDISNNHNLVNSFIAHQNKIHNQSNTMFQKSDPANNPNNSINGIVFKPLILTNGLWPSLQSNATQLWPQEMEQCLRVFERFYGDHTSGGKKLSWLHSVGHCSIIGRFWSGEYEINIPTLYTCVLLQFNSIDKDQSLSIRQVASNLNIASLKQVAQIFKKLASTKTKLIKLKAATDGAPSTVDSEFIVNEDFKSNLKKIKISESSSDDKASNNDNSVTSKGSAVVKEVKEVVERDRTYAIEAALIRIMKTRKTMNHKALIEECSKQLLAYFKPEVKMIKQRIETLIEREFIERDPEDNTRINYRA